MNIFPKQILHSTGKWKPRLPENVLKYRLSKLGKWAQCGQLVRHHLKLEEVLSTLKYWLMYF